MGTFAPNAPSWICHCFPCLCVKGLNGHSTNGYMDMLLHDIDKIFHPRN